MDIYGDMNPADLNDTLVGTDDPDTIFGGQGDDSIDGGAGADSLDGGAGNDTLVASGDASDTLNGGSGDDTYYIQGAITPTIVEADGGGTDTVVSFETYTDLGNYANVENLTLETPAGNEFYTAQGVGNALDNVITSTSANVEYSYLSGADGNDTLIASGSVGVYADGGAGNDSVSALSGNASLYGEGGADTLDASGTSAPNQLFGGDDNDRLVAGAGGDTLDGGPGADTMTGGAGTDSLTGGAGVDTFRFDGPTAGSDDTVVDFVSGTDKVALSHTGFGIAGLSDFDIVTAAAGPTEAKATLIVDTVAHTLSWDADGTGAGAATLLAHGAFTTNAADYLVF